MDDDDIYGSILSDPKSNSTRYSENYSEANPQQSQHTQSSNSNSNYSAQQSQVHQGQSQFSTTPVPPQPSLFVSGLTWWTSEDDLRQILGDLSNRVKELQFLENKPNGKSKGMVIIEFVDVATAEVAKEMLEGREISGKVCEVSFARNPPVKPYERSNTNYNPRDGQRNAPRQHYRLDQQYHQNHQNQRQGYETSYHHQQQQQHQSNHQDEYNSGSSRYVHREDNSSSSGYDNRTSSSSRYRRDARSRSPDRRSSSNKSYRY